MSKKSVKFKHETDMYQPVKALLEAQNYVVKGEIGKADIVAIKQDDDTRSPIIVELKTGFSLTLFHQAIERQSITDFVYIAVPKSTGRAFQKSLKNNMGLCRRLGLGLITVRPKDQFTEIHLDPAPYSPRKSKAKQTKLLREFQKLMGDPNMGGQARKDPKGNILITAYRQDALTCLKYLSLQGAQKASIIAKHTKVETARLIMFNNHYGWFERAIDRGRGFYQISPNGKKALNEFKATLDKIEIKIPD